MTLAMYEALAAAISQAERDPAIRMILIHGHGDSFTAGNDIGDFAHTTARGDINPAFSRNVSRSQEYWGHPLLRPVQQLAEVTAVAEHQVTDDDQALAILQSLESQIHRAARAWAFVRAPSTNCAIRPVDLACNQFAERNQNRRGCAV